METLIGGKVDSSERSIMVVNKNTPRSCIEKVPSLRKAGKVNACVGKRKDEWGLGNSRALCEIVKIVYVQSYLVFLPPKPKFSIRNPKNQCTMPSRQMRLPSKTHDYRDLVV